MQSKQLIGNIFKFLLFTGLGCAILYLLYQNQTADYLLYCQEKGIPTEDCSLIHKIFNDFRNANYIWIAIVLLCYTLSCMSRAIRWQMMLRPLGAKVRFGNAFMSLMLGYFANLGVPRLGEVLRPATLARYETVAFEHAIGTIVTERAIDVLMLGLMMCLGFLLQFDVLWGYLSEHASIQEKISGLLASPLVWGAGILLLIVVLLAIIFRQQLLKHSFTQKIIAFVKGLWDGILSIRELDKPLLFVGHTLFIWLMYYLMTYLAFFAFEPTSQLAPVVGLMVFLFGTLGIVLPTPGGMGAYQALVTIALSLYGLNSTDGFSFSNIVFFTIQIGANVLLGFFALLFLPIFNQK